MRLTRAGEYAVRCILYLSKKGKGVLESRKEIAEHAVIRGHFLAKIAQELARAGMIEISQGAKGGFRLLINPGEITLLQVVETMPIRLTQVRLIPQDWDTMRLSKNPSRTLPQSGRTGHRITSRWRPQAASSEKRCWNVN